MALVRTLDRQALSHEYRIAMREGAECGIAQLERELAEARRDAERYRWLRVSKVFYAPLGYEADGERLDAAIDEAMKEK